MSILARRQLRLATLGAIQAVTGVTVVSPGDWDTPPVKLPEIKLRCTLDRKRPESKQVPNFTTTVTLEILARVQETTAEGAQDAIEALGQLIEFAVLGCVPLIRLVQQVAGVTTQVMISSEGEQHIGRALMSVDLECFEAFDPTEINPADYPALAQLNLHLDTINPFDPGLQVGLVPLTVAGRVDQALLVGSPTAGNYPNPAFPQSVVPAPRTHGPDGRDEGFLQIKFT